MSWLLLLLLLVLSWSGGEALRRHRADVAAETLQMLDLGLPPESAWRPLLFSLAPFLLLEPWEIVTDEVQLNLSLAQAVSRLETRPRNSDMCLAVAVAAGETMRQRAMDAGQTLDRLASIAGRVEQIQMLCYSTLPDAHAFPRPDEDRAFRDTLLVYRHGQGLELAHGQGV